MCWPEFHVVNVLVTLNMLVMNVLAGVGHVVNVLVTLNMLVMNVLAGLVMLWMCTCSQH